MFKTIISQDGGYWLIFQLDITALFIDMNWLVIIIPFTPLWFNKCKRESKHLNTMLTTSVNYSLSKEIKVMYIYIYLVVYDHLKIRPHTHTQYQCTEQTPPFYNIIFTTHVSIIRQWLSSWWHTNKLLDFHVFNYRCGVFQS